MLTTIPGVYKGGIVELEEAPAVAEGAAVLVTFLDKSPQTGNGKMITLGMFPDFAGLSFDDIESAEFDEKKWFQKWEKAKDVD